MRPTRAYVDLTKLEENIKSILQLMRSNRSHADYMAVVKADGYGHGAVEVSRCATSLGVKWLGVAIPEEGMELRLAGIKEAILILGPIDTSEAELVVEYDLIPTVFSKDILLLLNRLGARHKKPVPVHIKLDTGMGRIGIGEDGELLDFLSTLRGLPYIDPQGVFTHFATSDEIDRSFTLDQSKRFEDMLSLCRAQGFSFKYIHAANSAAAIGHPDSHFDLVRVGISMYGYCPAYQRDLLNLVPILEWHTKVMHIKEVDIDTPISYGCTFTTRSKTKVGTLPVGYADGYNRLMSNRGHVLIGGKKAPIIGRICMDQTMVDITHIPNVRVGDDVILMGRQLERSITAEDIAVLCNTIPYEVLTGISKRVDRIYI